MKRKLGIIILAILLCAVLAFTLVACGNKNDEPQTPADPGNSNSGSGGGLDGVTEAQIATVEADLKAYLNDWVSMNATEDSLDQKSLLKKALDGVKNSYKLKGNETKPFTPSFTVAYKDGTYTVTASWNQGALKKTFTVDEVIVNYTNWSGKNSSTADYTYLDGANDTMLAVDTIIAAFVNSANKVTQNAVTGKFGMDGTLGFDAFGANYALRVKGNVDTASKVGTEVGLVVENGSGKEIAGLYYKGAEKAKDSRVYIQYPVTENGRESVAYKYIEYADILGFVNALLVDEENNSIVKERPGDGVFAGNIDGLAALLSSFDVDSKISGMIPGIVKLVAKAYKNGDRYLIDINLAEVMKQVSQIIDMVGNVNLEFLDKIGLNLSEMYGLRGHISISAKVKTEGGKDYLSDFELAVNIPEDTTFHFSKAEDAIKIDLPSIGFAIYLEDFSFVTSGETPIRDVVPQAAITNAEQGKGYFSPTNVDLSGDVYVNHVEGEEASIDSTFHFEFVTDINPLEIIENGFDSTARAALVIKQHAGEVSYAKGAEGWSNFLSVSYEQESHLLCVSGTAFGLEDDGNTVYKYNLYTKQVDGESGAIKDVINMRAIKRWLGLWDAEDGKDGNYHGLKYGGDKIIEIVDEAKAFESAKAIFGNELVKELIAYFFAQADEDEAGAVAEATFMDDIGKYVDGIKEIYNQLVEEGVIVFNTDPFSLSVNVTDETIATVVDAINETFKLELDADGISDLKIVQIEANSEGFEDKVYVKVKYGDNLYEVTFDGSSEESKFVITFKMTLKSNRSYTVVFDATSGDNTWTASVDFDIVDGEGNVDNHTKVALSNFHGEWGNNNAEEIEALLDGIKVENEGEIFPEDGTGPATALAKGLLGFLSSEKNKSVVTEIGKFIIRQIAG